MNQMTSKWNVLVLAMGVSAVIGCASGAEGSTSPNGSGTDNESATNPNGEGRGSSTTLLSGRVTSTFASTSRVRVGKLTASGTLESIAEAVVGADGRYAANVAAGSEILVVEALSARGEVVGSAIAGVVASGTTTIAAPVSTESSIEAQALLSLVACGSVDARDELATLLAFVDEELADAIARAVAAGHDAKLLVRAVAEAVHAAHTALRATIERAGAKVDGAVTALQLTAIETLHKALDAGTDAREAIRTYVGSLDAALGASAGLTAQAVARARASASAAFGLTIEGALGVSAQASATASLEAVAFAAIHAAAKVEALIVARAVTEVFRATDASGEALAATIAAGERLIAEVRAATSVSAILAAKDAFARAIVGDVQSGTSSVLDLLAPVTTPLAAVRAKTIEDLSAATAKLHDTLHASVPALAGLAVCVSADGQATARVSGAIDAVVQATGTFGAETQGLAENLRSTVGDTKARALGDALGLAQTILQH